MSPRSVFVACFLTASTLLAAYVSQTLLHAPRAVTILAAIAVYMGASEVCNRIVTRADGRRMQVPPTGWPIEPQSGRATDRSDISRLLERSRRLAGELAVTRIAAFGGLRRSGHDVQWAARRDAVLLQVHHVDAVLAGAQCAYGPFMDRPL